MPPARHGLFVHLLFATAGRPAIMVLRYCFCHSLGFELLFRLGVKFAPSPENLNNHDFSPLTLLVVQSANPDLNFKL